MSVVICYNRRDSSWALGLRAQLRERGIAVTLDAEQPGGSRYHEWFAAALREAETVLVLLGPSGVGPFQELEIEAALSAYVDRKVTGSRSPSFGPSRDPAE